KLATTGALLGPKVTPLSTVARESGVVEFSKHRGVPLTRVSSNPSCAGARLWSSIPSAVQASMPDLPPKRIDVPRPPVAEQEEDLDLLSSAMLTPLERAQIRLVRATLRPGLLDRGVRFMQRSVGQWWIRTATHSLRRVHGLERLPAWD